MFRRNKRVFASVLLGAVLLSVPAAFGGGTAAAAEEKTARSLGLCDEDRYLLLKAPGNSNVAIYDSNGVQVGECRAAMEGYQALTVGKNALLSFSDGEKTHVYSMAELKYVLEFPQDEYWLSFCGEMCLAIEKNGTKAKLYDNRGRLLHTLEWTNPTQEEVYGEIRGLDSGYLIWAARYGADTGNLLGQSVLVGRDGRVIREITDPLLLEAMDRGNTVAFGDYLVVYDWENDTHCLYDLEGKTILEHVDTTLSAHNEYNYAYDYSSKAEILLVKEQGIYTAYTPDLQKCGTFSEDSSRYPQYYGGFITGLAYSELGGRRCTGFVQYNGEQKAPVAETDGGYYVYADGGLEFVPMESGTGIRALNAAYLLGERMDEEDNYMQVLLDRATGETLAVGGWKEGRGVSITLQKSFCIILEEHYEENTAERLTTIMDNRGKTCYRSDTAYCYAWKKDYLMMKRGIYQGIADRYGNWIIRSVAGWSE